MFSWECFFLGSHTGSRIYDLYDQVLTQYKISNKVSFIVTDNASNMKAAFKTRFPSEENTSSTDLADDPTDNEDLWSRETEDDSVSAIDTDRIGCFAHTLQLSVGDGLRETKAISSAMSKSTKLASTLHRSTTYKVCGIIINCWPDLMFEGVLCNAL